MEDPFKLLTMQDSRAVHLAHPASVEQPLTILSPFTLRAAPVAPVSWKSSGAGEGEEWLYDTARKLATSYSTWQQGG